MSNPLILGTNSIKDTGFDVANSLRFDNGSSDTLTKTPTTSNRKTWTYSAWCKRSKLSSSDIIILFGARADANDNFWFGFQYDNFRIKNKIGGTTKTLTTNRLFRDSSAWYHIVISMDTTQATDSNRTKIYINGVQETSFSTEEYPSLNADTPVNYSSSPFTIGDDGTGAYYFDGYMAEVCLIDGTALDPTSFGEFDEDTGIWKPIDVSGLTFGTNGFYLDFENSGSLGADVSGNGNNFTVNNLTSIDQTTDTPTNNYSTLNPLHRGADDFTNVIFKDGNTTFDCNESGTGILPVNYSSIGMSQGKWYCEVNCIADVGTAIALGIEEGFSDVDYGGQRSTSIAYKGSNGEKRVNDTSSAYGNSFTSGDTIGIALDLDNNYVYFSKNGTWQNSGDPESGATGTGGISVVDSSSTTTGVYHFAVSDNISSGTFEVSFNFGNPAYTISSGNSDGNGMGNFEYSVPSGYYAFNTKNLARYG